ncbi:tRNA pseudouridine(38/39) synthase isoform X2 [Agrilus planipennis]|uniref:tRNA pseudouridine(38/39) synthase isoform X2 n=1 Tax=Agrilus planipennis TaxID=224129 RepID=A0A7F5R2U4_AGRPL|nr:tRNA pseudouridine(38/39) synthase isoform X2 [Agrilus planipennis]
MKMCEIEKDKELFAFKKNLLSELPKDELIKIVTKLEVHNEQLKNIIKKSSSSLTKSRRTQKPFDFSSCKFRHVLLKLFYIGWNYQGYASQEDSVNTIEHCLFEALQKTCLIKNRSSSNYHRCGRTDKGVSSFGQTVSIDLRSKLNKDNLDDIDNEINYCKVLNKVLPKEIRCIAWCPVPNDFSARFDCESRTYKYYFNKGNLDIQRMKEGAQYLLGTHDFRNFCKMDVNNGVVNFSFHYMCLK